MKAAHSKITAEESKGRKETQKYIFNAKSYKTEEVIFCQRLETEKYMTSKKGNIYLP